MVRTTKETFIVLLLGVLLLVTRQSAIAFSEVPQGGGNVIQTNPNAPGTKLFITVTIYYEVVVEDLLGCNAPEVALGDTVNMFFFMRVQKGNALFPFSHPAGQICRLDIPGQQEAIVDFVRMVVVPQLFPGLIARSVDLKSFSLLVQGDLDPQFATLDAVFAVQ